MLKASNLILVFILFSILLKAQKAELIAQKSNHVKGEIIFQLAENQFFTDFKKLILTEFDGSGHEYFTLVSPNLRIYSFHFDSDIYDEKMIWTLLQTTPSVSALQFNHFVEERRSPDDPQFSEQWALSKIGASSVWDKTTGGLTACGDTIVVAILEKGFKDRNAEDLQANIWLNNDEIPNNDIDDDGNGYVDDYRGVAFSGGKDNHSSSFIEPRDLQHGISVAGVIGASGNNSKLISGINWQVKLMLISGVTDEAAVIRAYDYVLTKHKLYRNSSGKQGAFVPITNFSGGFINSSPTDQPLLCTVYDSLGKYGILNFLAVVNTNDDVEKIGDMPTLCARESIVAVTASDVNDITDNSAYNEKYVHLAAPGRGVLLLADNNQTKTDNGTSFASPLVAGAAALLWSMPAMNLCDLSKTDPVAAMNLVKGAILRGVDTVSNLQGRTVTGGRLNIDNSYQELRRSLGLPVGNINYGVLKVAPNPVDEMLFVVFQLPETSNGKISIHNSLGQNVFQRKITKADLIAQKTDIATNWLGSGIYFLRISTDELSVTKKFVVAR